MARKPDLLDAARRRAAAARQRDLEIDAVAGVQAQLPNWVVIWSPWRREFSAFCCCAETAIVVDDRVIEHLVKRAHTAELANVYGRPAR